MVHELAPAKLNLVLHVGPPDGGMHPIASLFASLELADDARGGGGARRGRHGHLPGRGWREPRRGGPGRFSRARRRRAPAARRADRQAHPHSRGARGRQRRRRGGAARRQPDRRRPARRGRAACPGRRPRLGRPEPGRATPRDRDRHRRGGRADRAAAGRRGPGPGPARAVGRAGVRGARPPRGLARAARPGAAAAPRRRGRAHARRRCSTTTWRPAAIALLPDVARRAGHPARGRCSRARA